MAPRKKEENEQKNRNDIEFLWYAKFVDIFYHSNGYNTYRCTLV